MDRLSNLSMTAFLQKSNDIFTKSIECRVILPTSTLNQCAQGSMLQIEANYFPAMGQKNFRTLFSNIYCIQQSFRLNRWFIIAQQLSLFFTKRSIFPNIWTSSLYDDIIMVPTSPTCLHSSAYCLKNALYQIHAVYSQY